MIKNIGIEEQVRLWDSCQTYCKLDETSGSFANDSVGGGAGTVRNGAFDSGGRNGYCWKSTSGTGYGIEFGNIHNFERTDSFSFSFWIKSTSNLTLQHILYKQVCASPYKGWTIQLDANNKIVFQLQNAASTNSLTVTTQSTVTYNIWTHVVVTYNGSSAPSGVKIYLNGVSDTLDTNVNNLSSSAKSTIGTSFTIGGRCYNNYAFIGYIDEVGVWNRELNSAEAVALYSNDNGKFYGTQALSWKDLRNYWNFNEISGTTVYDRKGSDNGTLSNAAARTTGGKSYSGMTFSSSRYCGYGTPFTWTAAQPYSISAWVKASTNPTPVIPILSNLDSTTSCSIDLYVNVNNVYFGLLYNNSSGRCLGVTSTTPISTTNWYHILATYNGGSNAYGLTIYVNGVPQALTLTNTLTNTGNLGAALQTNRRYTTSYDNASIVDEIGIFTKCLTIDHALALYNAGNGIYY
jgi:hypothetical protein